MPTLVQEILRVGKSTERSFQRKQVLMGIDEPVEPRREQCVHELFERQAELNPEALAIVSTGDQITFRELNYRANQLARFLKRFGVGPNSLVGLCLPRSPEMLVGILGILKAGAAYVPLDPASSPDRMAFMIREANVFVLLTLSTLLEGIPRHDGPRLSLDSDWDVIAKERRTNPPRRATPRNLAYVIYNSAEADQPKGVRISHRGLLNYLSWGAEAYGVAKGSAAAVDESIPFDLAITRVLSPLIVGRSVLLVETNLSRALAAS